MTEELPQWGNLNAMTENHTFIFSPSGALWQGEGDAGERDEGEGNEDNNEKKR